jgi:hypothetical protein
MTQKRPVKELIRMGRDGEAASDDTTKDKLMSRQMRAVPPRMCGDVLAKLGRNQ